MNDRPRRRRQTWMKSQSEGFRPIRQVGIAYSIGFPLMVVGLLLLAIAASEGDIWLWFLAGGLFTVGLLAAASGRVT